MPNCLNVAILFALLNLSADEFLEAWKSGFERIDESCSLIFVQAQQSRQRLWTDAIDDTIDDLKPRCLKFCKPRINFLDQSEPYFFDVASFFVVNIGDRQIQPFAGQKLEEVVFGVIEDSDQSLVLAHVGDDTQLKLAVINLNKETRSLSDHLERR